MGESAAYFSDFENGKPDFLHVKSSKLWDIVEEYEPVNSSYFLKPFESQSPELIFINTSEQQSLYVSCLVKSKELSPGQNVLFRLNYTNEQNYLKIQLFNDKIRCAEVINGVENHSKEFHAKILDTIYSKYSLISYDTTVEIKRNGSTIALLDNVAASGNKIGFGSLTGNVFFDDLKFTSDLNPYFQETFFMQSIERMKTGERTLKWKFHNGRWQLRQQDGIMPLQGQKDNEKTALVTTGEEYWKDYTFSAAIHTNEEAGICFYIQNPENYYSLRFTPKETGEGRIQLLKTINDTDNIIKEIKYPLYPMDWYRLSVTLSDNIIHVFLDQKKIFSCQDSSFHNGAIGLCSENSNGYSLFDDILVAPASMQNGQDKEVLVYTFEMREKAGYDFCDWQNAGNIFTRVPGTSMAIDKKIFEEVSMINKSRFTLPVTTTIQHRNTIIPKDINCITYFKAGKEDNFDEYRLTLNDSLIFLEKNREILVRKNRSINRKNYSVTLDNTYLVFKSGEEVILDFPLILDPIQPVRIGVGYGGIGIGKILINQIEITGASILLSFPV